MKGLSSEQLKTINAQSKTGKFIEAIVFTRDQSDPDVKDYFIRYSRPITFNGNTYNPLDFMWSGVKVSSAMELPSVQVTISNLGGQVLDYIEQNNIEIEGNDVWLQILHIDKYAIITFVDEMLFQVEALVADYHTSATFHLGVNYSLNDQIPRFTLEKQEFPGIRDDVIRVGT